MVNHGHAAARPRAAPTNLWPRVRAAKCSHGAHRNAVTVHSRPNSQTMCYARILKRQNQSLRA